MIIIKEDNPNLPKNPFVILYIEYLKGRQDKSKTYIKLVKGCLNNFFFFVKKDISEINLKDIDNFIFNKLDVKSAVSKRYFSNLIYMLRPFFTFLVDKKFIKENPIPVKYNYENIFSCFNTQIIDVQAILDLKKQRKIIESGIFPNQFCAMWFILTSSIILSDELFNIKKEDLFLDGCIINVYDKNNNLRYFPISPKARDAIRIHLYSERIDSKYLFHDKMGEKIERDYIYDNYKKLVKLSESKRVVSLKKLNYAIRLFMLKSGMNLYAVKYFTNLSWSKMLYHFNKVEYEFQFRRDHKTYLIFLKKYGII